MVKVEFKFTEELFVECCVRHRRCGRAKWIGVILRSLGSVTCAYLAWWCYRDAQIGYLVFFVFAFLFFNFFGHFNDAFARFNHRRSPYRDEDVSLDFSEAGVAIKSPTCNVVGRHSRKRPNSMTVCCFFGAPCSTGSRSSRSLAMPVSCATWSDPRLNRIS